MQTILKRCCSGQTIVVLVATFIVLMLMLALAMEWGRLTRARTEMQQWCDAAALAGAADLPNAGVAKSVAASYYARNLDLKEDDYKLIGTDGNTSIYQIGTDKVYITTPYDSDVIRSLGISPEYAMRVCSERDVGLYFGELVGIPSMRASACATGVNEGAGACYVFYNCDPDNSITITGSNVGERVSINGRMHTNQDFIVHGHNHRGSSPVTVAGRVVITGTGHSFNIVRVPLQPCPEFPTSTISLESYRKMAAESGQLIIGRDYRIDRSKPPSGVVYVEGGDITGVGDGVSANVTLIAVRMDGRGGNIRITGNSWDLRASDGITLMYATDSVDIHATNSSFDGLIYISDGDFRFTGSNSTSKITVVARRGIRIDGRNLIFEALCPSPIAIRGGIILVE
ncbi:MAG: pilus assembly protein TadG-related protein [Armatimonadota bacterium]|nr:pilus assembly protein TadG-related protein [Armatimonadota bacterium]MCX7777674.1 pilus assembly protein TadG-related protein [Armatimonadota bacterium]MDW8025433.1 pilus assembly protein TadG-related protein [Armatimonadota bacterium]